MDLKAEKELIHRAKNDPELFGEIFEKYYPKILNYVVRRTGNVALAEDITAETFFKALRKLWQFEWRNVPFSAWLYKIATNEINQFLRKSTHKDLSIDDLLEKGFDIQDHSDLHDEILLKEAELKSHEDFLFIQKKLKKLPLKYQEVISLKWFESKKMFEISQILNKKEGTIKSLLSRGMARLRKECDEIF